MDQENSSPILVDENKESTSLKNKKKKHNNNRIIIFLCTIFIIVLALIVTLSLINQHKKRFLTEAEAYLSLADKPHALPLLKKYLLQNPKDMKVKILFAETLSDMGKKEEAVNLLKTSIIDCIRSDKDNKFLFPAFVKYNLLKNDLLQDISKELDTQITKKSAERLSFFCKEGALLITDYKAVYDLFKSTKPIDEIYSSKEDNDYAEKFTAYNAISFWLEGKTLEANIESMYGTNLALGLDDSLKEKTSDDYLWQLRSYGDDYCEREEWNQGIKTFKDCYEYCKYYKENESGAVFLNLIYKAYLFANDSYSAQETLIQLKKEFPNYKIEYSK